MKKIIHDISCYIMEAFTFLFLFNIAAVMLYLSFIILRQGDVYEENYHVFISFFLACISFLFFFGVINFLTEEDDPNKTNHSCNSCYDAIYKNKGKHIIKDNEIKLSFCNTCVKDITFIDQKNIK